jgi:hypothetical protein
VEETRLGFSLMRSDLNLDDFCFTSALIFREFCVVRTTHIDGFFSRHNLSIFPQASDFEEASRTGST